MYYVIPQLIGMTMAIGAMITAAILIRSHYADDLRQKANFVQEILAYVLGVLQRPDGSIVLRHENETLRHSTFSAHHFFCDSMCPVHPHENACGDHNEAQILRTLDGYIGLTESTKLQEHLDYFHPCVEHDGTLKFYIAGAAGSSKQARTKHGLFYRIEVEHSSGMVTQVMSGVLPGVALAQVNITGIFEEIFAKLLPTRK